MSILDQSLDAIPVACVELRPNGEVLRTNTQGYELLGHPSPGDRWGHELVLVSADGDPCPVDEVRSGSATVQTSILRTTTGRVVQATTSRHERNLFLTLHDLTPAWDCLAERRRGERLAQEAARMARVGGWTVPLDGSAPIWSATVKEIHEVPPDFLPNLAGAIEFYAPEAREEVQRRVNEAIETGLGWDFELPLITANQRRVWVRAQGRPEWEDGKVVRLVGTFQDIDEQVRVRQALEAAVERTLTYERLFQLGLGLYCLASADGFFLEVNDAWVQKLGYSREELTSRRFVDFVHPDDVSSTLEMAGALVDGASTVEFTNRYRTSDGRYLWLLWHSVFDPSSQRILAVATDVTQLKAQKEALGVLAKKAEEASQAKSTFLATMSHEIRTPLNGVLGMTQLLLSTQLNDTQRDYARHVLTTGKTLLTILNDILDFSKIEAGQMELENTTFNLATLIREVVQLELPRALDKGVVLQLDVEGNLPDHMAGDPGRVRQVLLNLVNNAVKFTDHGFVRIEARLDDSHITIAVVDSGCGVPTAQQPMLFAPFTQADSSTQRRFGGTGLGLAICHELVTLMDGELGMESTLGEGSRFWLRLPILPAGPPPLAAPTPYDIPSIRPSQPIDCQALIVEDNQVNQMVIQGMLETLGCTVTVAANGQEALDLLDRFTYDVVFMDCQMPVLDGYEATRRLRLRDDGENVPVIALTANALLDDRQRCLNAGMDDYIPKPVELPTLEATLRRWVCPD